MSCPLIIGMVTLTAIALAMAQLSLITSTEPPPGKVESCEALDKFNYTELMESKTFTKNLDECAKSKNENKTQVVTVFVDLFRQLKWNQLGNFTDYPELMKQTSECATNITGLNFTVSETRKRFGLPNITVTLKFEMPECKNSLKLAECIEGVYAGQLNAITKNHKNAYMRLFNVTEFQCKEAWIEDEDRSNSQYCIPSFILILGLQIMIFKLLM